MSQRKSQVAALLHYRDDDAQTRTRRINKNRNTSSSATSTLASYISNTTTHFNNTSTANRFVQRRAHDGRGGDLVFQS